MKNWKTLETDKTKLTNKNFTAGRGGQRISYIVKHHNAANPLTTEECWNTWQIREASAHYQVEIDGTIGRLVKDTDTAWHANNLKANQESIGIEHANSAGADQDYPISDKTIEEGAHLAAALCVYHKLGRPEFGKNIRDHREISGTSCPYHLAQGRRHHDHWMLRAQYWYDQMTNSHSQGGNKMTVLSGVSAAALNDTKHAAWKALDNSADNRTQLRGPNDQGWNVDDLVGYARKRDGALKKGTLVELLAVSLHEQRALAAEVKALRGDVAGIKKR
ncbi:N-acetylmuramoyl-L-alanine amidase [Corynebacterium oculi]|uniref:N-acetylmuramoyl-L-alanine amidase n=1 Tax=Corynebacterium oculi TaxID=1544416 RepID=A0A0Q0YRJ7_9CORY|nr:peptidoglycan recognition family protein [Corynebacterium oculi]KQB85019.1 N-acetylmuramoyl-L-alanine amidase [Corynebacterium oculi]